MKTKPTDLFRAILLGPAILLAAALMPDRLLGQDRTLDPATTINWQGNLDAAFLESKKNNVPVMIVFHSKANPHCLELVEDIYQDPELVRLTRNFICVAACSDEHDDAVVRDGEGTYRTVCDYFRTVTCEEHQRVWNKAMRTFYSGVSIQTPLHLFVHPDGTKITNISAVKNPKVLIKTMKEVLDRMSPDRDDPVFHALDEDERKFITELRRLKGADASLRRFILGKLVRWEGGWVYPKLGKYIEEAAAHSEAVHIIRAMGFEGNRRGADFLRGFEKHKNRELRLHAAVSYEAIALEPAAGLVKSWLGKEKDERVRGALMRALAASDPAGEGTLNLLQREIKSGKPAGRRNATVALGIVGLAQPDNARPILEKLTGDADENVSACACWALGWMRSRESLDVLMGRMEQARNYRMIILLEDAVHRAMGRDPFGYMRHLEKYAGDTIIRGEKWPPERRDWGM